MGAGAWRANSGGRGGAGAGSAGGGSSVGVGVTLARKFRPNSQSLLARLGFVCSVGAGEKRQESQHKEETLGPQARSHNLLHLCMHCNLLSFFASSGEHPGLVPEGPP